MTEQQLISKLQELKDIKPRKEWVFLIKSKILDTAINVENEVFENKITGRSVLWGISKVIFQRKFAYSLAAFLFVVAGLFGVMKYQLPSLMTGVKTAQQSKENLVAIKSDVEDFKVKSKSLSQIAILNSQDISLAVKEVNEAVKEITIAIQKDPQLAKEVALEVNNNKTYLEVIGGGELKATSDVLYKMIVEQMIKDLENTTLGESQKEALDIAKDLYNQGKYANALESVLLLDMAIKNK